MQCVSMKDYYIVSLSYQVKAQKEYHLLNNLSVLTAEFYIVRIVQIVWTYNRYIIQGFFMDATKLNFFFFYFLSNTEKPERIPIIKKVICSITF